MSIARIERLALSTADLSRARDFYEQQLGAVEAPGRTHPRLAALEFCGVRLELTQRPAHGHPAPAETHPSGHARIGFALGSADAVDELTARLARAGYAVLQWPRRTPAGAYESLVLDPDGNPIAFTV